MNHADCLNFDFKAAGHELLATIRKGFWNPVGYFAKEKLIGTDKAFFWPYGGHLEAVAAQLENYPDCANAKQMYLDTLLGVLPYTVCRDDGHLAYAAANGGGGDVFYDDNVWIAIIYLNASHILKEPRYLELSERVTEFCYSGWDEKLGGGVYWQENHKTSKNTCINAPLAKVSAQLYKETGKQKYLDWAVKLYDWTKEKLMDPKDYLYWDNINLEGKIQEWKFAYNTGCMIGAAAHLYDITKDEKYLTDAKNSAMSALNGGFGRWDDKGDYHFTDPNPWFLTWLLDGYMALYPFDSNDEYIESFASAVSYCVRETKNASGFVHRDWKSKDMPDADVHVLDQSGTVRVLFDVQTWKDTYGK